MTKQGAKTVGTFDRSRFLFVSAVIGTAAALRPAAVEVMGQEMLNGTVRSRWTRSCATLA